MVRVDKRKNIWKVAEVIAVNPNKTQREIAKETNISLGAVNSSLKEVEQSWTKDPTIAYIVGNARERIKRVWALFDRYLDEIEEKNKLERWDMQLAKDIVKDDMARVTVLWWDVTDKDWAIKKIDEIKIIIWD
jgi:predicted transcriptional regulator